MSDTATAQEESRSMSLKDDVTAERTADYEGEMAAAGGDIEEQVSRDEEKIEEELEPADPYLVNWNGADDPENPLNFSKRKKIGLMTMIAAIAFLTYIPSFRILGPGPSLANTGRV
jgi:hypothetical protein